MLMIGLDVAMYTFFKAGLRLRPRVRVRVRARRRDVRLLQGWA